MTTKNIYLQDSSNNNLLPVTDWSNLLNVPSTLQATDKLVTNSSNSGVITGTDSTNHAVNLYYSQFGKVVSLLVYNVKAYSAVQTGTVWLTFPGKSAFASAAHGTGLISIFGNSASSQQLRFYASGSDLVCTPTYSAISSGTTYTGMGTWIIN